MRCDGCHHEMSNGRCWRLTCPSNGAGVSSAMVRDRVMIECAAAGRDAQWFNPFAVAPDKAYVGTLFDEDDEDA